MGLFRPLNDKRVAGTNYLKIIERSVGYLQGGYYTGAIPGNRNSGNPAGSTYPPAGINRGAESAWSHVQSFSGITQVGKIVYDTGYARRYFAGVTGNYAGYISINNNYDFQKFSYFTAATSQSFSTVNANNCTAVDLNHYTQAWILETTTPEATSAEITNFVKVFLSTETPVDNGKIGAGAIGTSRQALNNQYAAFLVSTGQTLNSLNYNTLTLTNLGSFFSMEQIASGMSVSDDHGYIVGYSNVRVNMNGASMTSYAVSTAYTYKFGESHSLGNSMYGFMMAGYPDTTGRYNSVQHGLCERLTLTTEAHTVLNDLVIPQSSGQIMQGF